MEERNKWFEDGIPFSEMGSRWDCMELKRGRVPVPVIETMDSEVNKKWTELERLTFSGMSTQSLIGAQAYQSSTTQASQSLVITQTHQSSPEEAEQFVTGSQADASSSKEALPSINGSQTVPTNTDEALQMEVRKTLYSVYLIIYEM